MWDPEAYLRFGTERARPFDDLLARVGAVAPRRVVDLGCGPGTLTETLARRWPGARITGLDSSESMIAEARTRGGRVGYQVADVRDWMPEPDVDVVVSHAVLQWLPGHEALLVRWARALPPGAWLAVQVPGNTFAESYLALRRVAGRPRWRDRVPPAVGPRPVGDPARYARRLGGAGCVVDAWETTYLHILPDRPADAGDHPVLRWLEGTALRPVRAVLDDADFATFRAELGAQLADAYPVQDGVVYFPFRRVFVVARTAGTAAGPDLGDADPQEGA